MFLLFENKPTVHNGVVSRGRVCGCGCWRLSDRWHATHKTWHMTHDTWQMTHYMWHVIFDMWHIQHDIIFSCSFSFSFLSNTCHNTDTKSGAPGWKKVNQQFTLPGIWIAEGNFYWIGRNLCAFLLIQCFDWHPGGSCFIWNNSGIVHSNWICSVEQNNALPFIWAHSSCSFQ